MLNYIKLNTIKEVLSFIKDERNLTKEQMLDFIESNKIFHSPTLLTNIQKAVDKIISYKDKTITIVGDYDVDGICSTTVLYKTLKAFNNNTYYIIPNRFTDGYGISNSLIDRAKQNNTDLIITVDNGIKSHKEVQYAKSLGIDVIITDHHAFEDDTLPCDITVNPHIDNNYPFPEICGCMVAYKLCMLLIKQLNIDIDRQELAHLTLLATIADIMPLLDENRWFVKHYINSLKDTHNIGLQALFNCLYMKKITAQDVGFYISPCLNASGRMETAEHAIDLLLSNDYDKAVELSHYIIKLNDERKKIQNALLDKVKVDDKHNVLFVVIDEERTGGILGIIAGHLSERYNKPCVVLKLNNDILSGSGRSKNNYAINRLIELNDYVTGGGHKQACGLELNKNDLSKLQEFADEDYIAYLSTIPEQSENVMQIDFDLISEKLIDNLNKLEPFGQGNPQPIFHTENVKIITYNVLGKNNNVIRFALKQNNINKQAIIFNAKLNLDIIYKDNVNIDYTLNYNEWGGTKTIQLNLVKVE